MRGKGLDEIAWEGALRFGLASAQYNVGEAGQALGMAEGSSGKALMHGMLGAGYAELTGGSAVTGFAAGAAVELMSPYLSSRSPSRDPGESILASARGNAQAALIGGVAAFAAGGSADDISTAGMVSSSAIAYNRELHPDAYVLKERAKELARRNWASESELEDIEDAAYYLAGAAEDLDPSDKSAKAEEIRSRAALGEKKARAVEKLLDSTAESGYDRRIWTDL